MSASANCGLTLSGRTLQYLVIDISVGQEAAGSAALFVPLPGLASRSRSVGRKIQRQLRIVQELQAPNTYNKSK